MELVFLQNSELSPQNLQQRPTSVPFSAKSLTNVCLTPLHQPSHLSSYFCPLLYASSGPSLCLFPSSLMPWSCVYCAPLYFQPLDLHKKV